MKTAKVTQSRNNVRSPERVPRVKSDSRDPPSRFKKIITRERGNNGKTKVSVRRSRNETYFRGVTDEGESVMMSLQFTPFSM